MDNRQFTGAELDRSKRRLSDESEAQLVASLGRFNESKSMRYDPQKKILEMADIREALVKGGCTSPYGIEELFSLLRFESRAMTWPYVREIVKAIDSIKNAADFGHRTQTPAGYAHVFDRSPELERQLKGHMVSRSLRVLESPRTSPDEREQVLRWYDREYPLMRGYVEAKEARRAAL